MGLELSSEHFASVAQLDRALASGARGCGFDPRRTQVDRRWCAAVLKDSGPHCTLKNEPLLILRPNRNPIVESDNAIAIRLRSGRRLMVTSVIFVN